MFFGSSLVFPFFMAATMHAIPPLYPFWIVCRHVEGADARRMAPATGEDLIICHARPLPGACRIPGIVDGWPEAQFPARSGSPDGAIHMTRDHDNCTRARLGKIQGITPARSGVTQSNTFDIECKQLHYALK